MPGVRSGVEETTIVAPLRKENVAEARTRFRCEAGPVDRAGSDGEETTIVAPLRERMSRKREGAFVRERWPAAGARSGRVRNDCRRSSTGKECRGSANALSSVRLDLLTGAGSDVEETTIVAPLRKRMSRKRERAFVREPDLSTGLDRTGKTRLSSLLYGKSMSRKRERAFVRERWPADGAGSDGEETTVVAPLRKENVAEARRRFRP